MYTLSYSVHIPGRRQRYPKPHSTRLSPEGSFFLDFGHQVVHRWPCSLKNTVVTVLPNHLQILALCGEVWASFASLPPAK